MNSTADPLKGLLQTEDLGEVLDVATGSGHFLLRLADCAGARTWAGLDCHTDSLERAGETLKPLKPNPRLLEGNALELPFPAASFDTVSLSMSLHHLEQPHRALLEMKRVLRPGGRLVVCEMIADHLRPAQRLHRELHHLAAVLDRMRGVTHRPTYRLRELKKLLEKPGLEWNTQLSPSADWPVEKIGELEGVWKAVQNLRRAFRACAGCEDFLKRLDLLESTAHKIGWGWQSQWLAVAHV